MKIVKFAYETQTGSGLTKYPDNITLFGASITIDDVTHVEYFGVLPLTESSVIIEDYLNPREGSLEERMAEDILIELSKIEGVQGELAIEAKENFRLFGDADAYKLIIAKKREVRRQFTEAVIAVNTSSVELQRGYRFTADVSSVTVPAIRRITVGSFWERISLTEFNKLTTSTDKTVLKGLAEINGRTHIDLDSDRLKYMLSKFGTIAFDILDTEPSDSDNYASRFDELLKDGNSEEAYNPL